jgi:hypothetical protein
MLTASALAERFELFMATATLASHASCQDGAFRQRDVRFFLELFSNWAEVSSFDVLPMQNTQIARYLSSLSKEGYLRRHGRASRPLFRMTRIGLIELLNRLVSPARAYPREYFFFLIFFVKGYGERLESLVKKEGSQFPPSLRVELQALLDWRTLVEREIKRTQQDLNKLDVRMADASSVSALSRERRRNGVGISDIVIEIQRKHPYELNSRKPLVELIDSIAPDQRQWELEHGTALRKEIIWEQQKNMMVQYLASLKTILRGS